MDPKFVLQVRNLSKAFSGVKVLDGVQLDIEPGKVHALLGENGAGKSTLMKILVGFHSPDAGEILFKGQVVHFHGPHDALRQGLSMIHQELLPCLDLTVAENIFMGREPASPFLGWIDQQTLRRDTQRLLDLVGAPLSPIRKMRGLGVAEMQMVEIAKALAGQAEVIIMDEPTSALSEHEIDALFRVILNLKQRGVAIIYISHKLDEIFRLADTVTVLRDGHYVATRPIQELDAHQLIAMMVGRDFTARLVREPFLPGEAALAVRGLGKAGQFQHIHFELRRGEILGLAGLMGAGRTALVNAIYGLAPADAGEICINGQSVRITCPRDALDHGIALVSEDRKQYGLVLKMSVKCNLTLSHLRRCCRGQVIDHQVENRLADDQIRSYAIRAHNRNQKTLYLSGGNQQKVVIAKALLAEPGVIILDEPTRGIDIGAKAEVYSIISRLARSGKAILLVSSELPELMALTDRILVMCQGIVTAELASAQTTPQEIMHYAMPRSKPSLS